MARVTVEDCTEVVLNRFELVALSAQRAKIISAGGALTVSRDRDKDAVVALREIAERTVNVDKLREKLVESFQSRANVDKYGVESSVAIDDVAVDHEVAEEMASLQHDDTEMFYGDELDVED